MLSACTRFLVGDIHPVSYCPNFLFPDLNPFGDSSLLLGPISVRLSTSRHYCQYCMFYCPTEKALAVHMASCSGLSSALDTSILQVRSDPQNKSSFDQTSEDDFDNAEVEDINTTPTNIAPLTNPELPFVCSNCGRGYRVAQSLQRHRWMCDRSRPMPCSHCQAVFYRADRLKRHLEKSHGTLFQGQSNVHSTELVHWSN